MRRLLPFRLPGRGRRLECSGVLVGAEATPESSMSTAGGDGEVYEVNVTFMSRAYAALRPLGIIDLFQALGRA